MTHGWLRDRWIGAALALLALLGGAQPTYAQAPVVAQSVGDTAVSNTLALPSIDAGTDQLYVAFFGIRRQFAGASVTGGSLTWTVTTICGARDQLDSVFAWAFGSPGAAFQISLTVTAATTISGVAARITGAGASSVGTVGVANTSGLGAATCTGGTDGTAASDDVTSTVANSLVLVGTAMRNQTITTADPDYTQVITQSGGTEVVRVYLHSRDLASASTDTIAHTLSAASDWSMAGAAIAPSGSPPPSTPKRLTLLGAGE